MITNDITFAMIKPDAVKAGNVGSIISLIEENGFEIIALRKHQLSIPDISVFYSEHIGKVYFEDLEQFMTSGPVFPIVLRKANAVVEFRKLLGKTNPDEAEEGTIRKLFASAKNRNACHGSDSNENAWRELSCFFNKLEILSRIQ